MDANEATAAPPPATLSEQVRKVLDEAAKPLTAKQVKSAVDKLYPKGTKPAAKPSPAGIQGELERNGAFEHPATKAGDPTYWHTPYVPPPTPAHVLAAKVRAKVDELADDAVVVEGKLGKPTGKKVTDEQTKAFADTLAELITAGTLHPHPGGKYGKKAPPPPQPPLKWYEKAPHKTKFAALMKAANTLFAAAGVTADEFHTAFRRQLGQTPPSAEKPKSVVVPPPVVPPPAHTELRAVLKQAYDHLCKFPEFRDRLVDLPSLFHETSERQAGVTAEAFMAELWRMGEEHQVQLHIINDVTAAKEPHLAISRDGDLYYYARWN